MGESRERAGDLARVTDARQRGKAGSGQVTWHASQTRASEGVNFLRAPLKTTFFDAVFCTNIINGFLKPNFTLLYFLYD
jgi:hypothetical protein